MKKQKKIKEELMEILKEFDKYTETGVLETWIDNYATEILNLFKERLNDTFHHLMKEFANTPIDKRGTGWDWLKKARDKLIEELK